MTQTEVNAKQNEMQMKDAAAIKAKSTKYKYKCTICKNVEKICASHVGLSSHLRSHVKSGHISDAQKDKIYKEIMEHPIAITTKTQQNAPIVIDDDGIKAKDFKNEVVDSSSSSSTDDNDDEDVDVVTFKCPKMNLPEKASANTPPCSAPSRSQSPNKLERESKHPMNDDDAPCLLLSKTESSRSKRGLSFDTNAQIASDKEKENGKGKERTARDVIEFGRIPKKTPEQQQQELLNKNKARKRREFSPEPMPSNHRNDQLVGRSSSRSNSSHSSRSSHSSSNYRNHYRSERDSKYRTRNRSRSKYNGSNGNSSYHRNHNPLYPQDYNHNADNRNVPALAPLHSPKHSNSCSTRKRHYHGLCICPFVFLFFLCFDAQCWCHIQDKFCFVCQRDMGMRTDVMVRIC